MLAKKDVLNLVSQIRRALKQFKVPNNKNLQCYLNSKVIDSCLEC